MKRGILASVLGAALLFTAACKAKHDDKEAIRAGIVKHLVALNMLNMNNMEIKVTQATVTGDQAQAQVEIRAKGTDPAQGGMQIGYALEKRGEEWVVLKSTGMGGGMQHPGPGEAPPPGSMPGGAPGAPAAAPGANPHATGGTVAAPANHPDFSAILNKTQSQQAPAQQPAPAPGKP